MSCLVLCRHCCCADLDRFQISTEAFDIAARVQFWLEDAVPEGERSSAVITARALKQRARGISEVGESSGGHCVIGRIIETVRGLCNSSDGTEQAQGKT